MLAGNGKESVLKVGQVGNVLKTNGKEVVLFYDFRFRLKCLWFKHVVVPYRFWKLENSFFPEDKCHPIFSPIFYATSAMTLAEAETYGRRLVYYQNQAHWRDMEKSRPLKLIGPEDRLALPEEIQILANLWNDGQTP